MHTCTQDGATTTDEPKETKTNANDNASLSPLVLPVRLATQLLNLLRAAILHCQDNAIETGTGNTN
jgi:hypothetical protein